MLTAKAKEESFDQWVKNFKKIIQLHTLLRIYFLAQNNNTALTVDSATFSLLQGIVHWKSLVEVLKRIGVLSFQCFFEI